MFPGIDEWRHIPGWCTEAEAIYLYHQARALPPGSTVVEIGAWRGRSTIPLAFGCKESGGHIYSVDNFLGSPEHETVPTVEDFQANIAAFGLQDIVTLLVADSVEAATTFPRPVHMLYLDGAHSRDAVYADACAWLPKCQPDSPILFHDYDDGWPGVGRAIDRLVNKKALTLQTRRGSIGHFTAGVNPDAPTKRIFWVMLMERNVNYLAAIAAMRIASRCARAGYAMIALPYTRTDDARNTACLALLKGAQNDTDTLVMLDGDHDHPPDVVERLTAHNVGVVGALYFRRTEPYDPMVFIRDKDGALNTPAEWDADAGLVPCTIVGTAAIAIQAGVLRTLMEKGIPWPWFRYVYAPAGQIQPTEDIYFGLACETAGIPHHVDFSLQTPHLTVSQVNQNTFERYSAEHPDAAPTVPILEMQVEA